MLRQEGDQDYGLRAYSVRCSPRRANVVIFGGSDADPPSAARAVIQALFAGPVDFVGRALFLLCRARNLVVMRFCSSSVSVTNLRTIARSAAE